MSRPFEGKSFVITGASSGIGEALALEVARQGGRLAVAARRLERLEQLAARVGPGVEVHPMGLDLSQSDQCEKLVTDAAQQLGGIDVLILNAGQTGYLSVQDSTMEEARMLMEVNYFGPLASIKAALPGMLARKKGHIVVVSSYCAYAHMPRSGPYSASKAAVASLTRVLATEVIPPLRVTVVYPGVIRTEMFQQVQSSVPIMQRFERGGMDADEAAKRILKAIQRRKLTLHLTRPAVIMDGLMRVAPNTIDWTTRKIFHRIPEHLLNPPRESDPKP